MTAPDTPGAPGWPDPSRPGVPLHPERDGWHWLAVSADQPPCPFEWSAHREAWGDEPSSSYRPADWHAEIWEHYLGPCLTPAEHAAALADARAQALEEAAEATDCGCAARPDVLARLAKAGERRAWSMCPKGDACCALAAAAIRALAAQERATSTTTTNRETDR